MPVTQNLLAFNRGTNQPLGILPQLPITLGGKFFYLNVIVVPGPLDNNLLLGRDVRLYGPDPGSEELFSQTNLVATNPFGNRPWSAD